MNFEIQPSVTPEVKKNKYYYIDRNATPPKIIFETVATNILDADKSYKTATGNDPNKQTHIGCQVIDVTSEKKPTL